MDLYSSKVDDLLHGAIDGRRAAVQKGEISSYGDDLLGRMLTAASEGWGENTQDFNLASVFNNCKLFYFAGQDTVANATNFALLMLALHPEWQDRARKEVLGVFEDEQNCSASAVSRLKVVCSFSVHSMPNVIGIRALNVIRVKHGVQELGQLIEMVYGVS